MTGWLVPGVVAANRLWLPAIIHDHLGDPYHSITYFSKAGVLLNTVNPKHKTRIGADYHFVEGNHAISRKSRL
jgi:hypothetical protein